MDCTYSMICNQGSLMQLDLNSKHIKALTRKEQLIIIGILSGVSFSEIGIMTKRSIKTISAHKKNIYNKLRVKNDISLFILLIKSNSIRIIL